jgi:hypothetical protein
VNFCEHCGQGLTPDARFCEQCGGAIAGKGAYESKDAKTPGGPIEACLVVVNTGAWCQRWGEGNAKKLLTELNQYLLSRSAASGLNYVVHEVGQLGLSPHLRDVISSLKDEVSRLEGEGYYTEYIFIIGGSDVPMADYDFLLWRESERGVHRDPDLTVATDHCYESLSFERLRFHRDRESALGDPTSDFVDTVAPRKYVVGRLPLAEDLQVADLIGYFRRATAVYPRKNSEQLQSLSVAAKLWQVTTEEVCHKSGLQEPITCPDCTSEDFARLCSERSPTLLFFNLHGSNKAGDSAYTGECKNCEIGLCERHEAVTPDCLGELQGDYLAVSEACYGARFCHPTSGTPYKKNDSIMLTAIYTRCLGFLGASRAAYGAAHKPALADLIAIDFLKATARRGHWSLMDCSLGEAAAQARFSIPAESNAAEEVLRWKNTLIFNFYGDPTLFHRHGHFSQEIPAGHAQQQTQDDSVAKAAGQGAPASGLLSELRASVGGLHGRLRKEVSGTIERVSKELRAEIIRHINQVIHREHPYFNAVEPLQACFRNSAGDSHLLSYQKESGGFLSEILVVTDDQGRIVNKYFRK